MGDTDPEAVSSLIFSRRISAALLLLNSPKNKRREKNHAFYIFRRVEDSTTTAGSSVELLIIGGYRPGSCILLTLFRVFFSPLSSFLFIRAKHRKIPACSPSMVLAGASQATG